MSNVFKAKAAEMQGKKEDTDMKVDDRKTVEIFSDTKRIIHNNQAVNYKQVFRIWATQILDKPNPVITLKELQEIFPEFKEKLDVYDNCCDASGKIVKNFEFYNAYKNKPHKSGKRGGTCTDDQKKAKEAKRVAQNS